MAQKTNYRLTMEQQIAALQTRPILLLHACCAPCSSAVIEQLLPHFKISLYYYNPNIFPEAEYNRRLHELQTFVNNFSVSTTLPIFVEPYDTTEFYTYTNVQKEPELQTEKEGKVRCTRCYRLRLEKTFNFAVLHNYDFFTTTLSISPHKDAEKINTLGSEIGTNRSPQFLFADFKKQNGYKRSLELSTEYNLYRQTYCGCEFSMRTTNSYPST